MNVREIMTPDPVVCVRDTSLEDVARMMADHDCGEIPVVENEDNRRPVGVVTDRDIVCRVVAEGENPLDMTAGDCMSQPVTTITEDADVEAALNVFEEHKIRRVPVVDQEGRCVGIVAQADIARKVSSKKTGETVKKISKAA
jgi:CBS domain-containing protein